ncbi:type II toxin-antitoxin system Phd/YefM family antitoxin [Oceanospirillum beijerinckii]|uniref:type II toxin-antitoxin system Phd/YefM family antitoxin n=1 Tax=Oceanospirillum beijerinckii TaxID=64976 RepID=UPI00041677D8|nr:type II toxin-antitoxin system Phd/YefM family antitoxin [Oceanospirillum beijerinckii]MAC45848.1 type II toxin-antitoxin system prevent-host-death family antitoxin [Oceanospirillum sp.]
MIRMTVNDFRAGLNMVVNKTATEHATVLIEGEGGNAVMISEEDWNSINDILQVVSMSGMAESIREGLQLEIKQTAEHID